MEDEKLNQFIEEMIKTVNQPKTIETAKSLFKQNFIYKLITRLIELQDTIDYQLEDEPYNAVYNELWWVIEEAKDRLKEIFNKV